MATGSNSLINGMRGSVGDITLRQRQTRRGVQMVMARRVAVNSSKSERQCEMREGMALRAELWGSLTRMNLRSWMTCGKGMRDPDRVRGQDKLSGYNCFQAINGVRQSLSLPPLLSAPELPQFLPQMGRVRIVAAGGEEGVWGENPSPRCAGVSPEGERKRITTAPSPSVSPLQGGTRERSEQGGGSPFSLTLHAEGHDGPFLIFAAPPDVGGRETWGRNRFTLLCAVDAIGPEGVDLSGVFSEVYGAAEAGERVVLRVVPVTEDGFKGRARVVICDVELAAVEENLSSLLRGVSPKGEKQTIPAPSLPFMSSLQGGTCERSEQGGGLASPVRRRRGPGVRVVGRGRRGRGGVLVRTVKGAGSVNKTQLHAEHHTAHHQATRKSRVKSHIGRYVTNAETYRKAEQCAEYRVSQVQQERVHGEKKAPPTPQVWGEDVL